MAALPEILEDLSAPGPGDGASTPKVEGGDVKMSDAPTDTKIATNTATGGGGKKKKKGKK